VASYLARTGEWKRVDELLAPLDAPAAPQAAGSTSAGGAGGSCEAPASAPAVPYELLERRLVIMARLRAAAMRRRLPETQRLLAERRALDAELRPYYEATLGPGYAARQKAIEISDEAMLARARRDDRALLPAVQVLAEQSAYEYVDEGTAGGNLATEEVAETLLRLGRTDEALAQYARIIAEHPGRASALLGAARTASRAGRAADARGLYTRLVAVWSEAEKTTPGLDEARAGADAAARR
jgi:tetratricopeptide (TPR) repeat protein